MKKTLLSLSAALLIASSNFNLMAADSAAIADTPEGIERARLSGMPDVEIRFQEAPLGDVLRTLAEAANMPYIGLPHGEGSNINVNMTIKGNPFDGLELVAETYGYAVLFENGLWYFTPIEKEQSKLYPKVYKLNYIQLTEIGASVSSPAETGDVSSPIPQSVKTDVFSSDSSKFIDDIKTLLAMDTSLLALSEQEALAGNSKKPDIKDIDRLLNDQKKSPSNSKQPEKSRVITNPDQNTIFVIATKEQHDWIQTYINAVDIPRKLVLLETRFVELQNQPDSSFGVDWSGSLDGLGLTLQDRDFTDLAEGNLFDIDTTDSSYIYAKNLGGAILSAPELSMSLHMLNNLSNSRTIQHPSQVTVNNRPVVLRSVKQEPFISGTSTNTNSGSSSSSEEIQYIPVGTTISLLPRILKEENIELSVMINISDITGYVYLGDSSSATPITSNKDYSGQAIVKTGNTLAIGGLESLLESEGESKVPFLGDIPFFGFLFNHKSNSADNSKLLMFITPTILDDYTGGTPTSKDIQAFMNYFEAQRDGDAGVKTKKDTPIQWRWEK